MDFFPILKQFSFLVKLAFAPLFFMINTIFVLALRLLSYLSNPQYKFVKQWKPLFTK